MNNVLIRLRSAVRPALIHLFISLAIATSLAFLIFGLWYPAPFDQISNGRELFILILAIDVTLGPLLTLIIFDEKKTRAELTRDLLFVFFLQFTALCYGVFNLMQARPVWLAFEGDRFRVVSVPDVDLKKISEAPPALQQLSLNGPQLLGVRLAQGQDADYRQSIELSLNGMPPAYRPQRWVSYDSQVEEVIQSAKPLVNLYKKHPDKHRQIDAIVKRANLKIEQLGYMPLLSEGIYDWATIVGLDDGKPKGYLNLDAWD